MTTRLKRVRHKTSIQAPRSDGAEGKAESLPPNPFRPIMGSRAALEVADQMTFAILSGYYEPGSRLPTIPELGRAMSVSPPVISEAVRMLSDAGVLDVRRGSRGGITVRSSHIPAEIRKLSRPRLTDTLRPVVEARRPVELAITRLAAVRITDSELGELERANARLILSRGNRKEWRAAHNTFHYTLGRSARNPVLAYFQHEILEEIALMLDGLHDRFMDPERTIREHRETLEALQAHDPDAAAA